MGLGKYVALIIDGCGLVGRNGLSRKPRFVMKWAAFSSLAAPKVFVMKTEGVIMTTRGSYCAWTINSLTIDSLWPSWLKCLTAPSHYLNRYWLIIRLVMWHSSAQFHRKWLKYLFLIWFWISIGWRLQTYFTGPMSYFARFDFKTGSFMMTSSNGNIFRVTGHLCGEFTGHRWIPRTKASDAELWWFLWYAPE